MTEFLINAHGGFAPKAVVHSSAVELIMRIMVGMLYMEHGLAKTPDFPHHAPFTLNPGLQGLLKLVGGLLLALG